METVSLVATILVAMGVPTAITGLFVWRIQKKLEARDKSLDEQRQNKEKFDIALLKSVTATMALSEATAKAVQQIPSTHCNGDMSSALAYVTKVKHEQKELLNTLGVHALY